MKKIGFLFLIAFAIALPAWAEQELVPLNTSAPSSEGLGNSEARQLSTEIDDVERRLRDLERSQRDTEDRIRDLERSVSELRRNAR